MQTYYIDSVKGCDTHSGITPHQPLKSLAAVNALSLQPGDSLLFRRGTVYFGCLSLSADGSENAPIFIGTYGEGENPQIIAGKDNYNTVEIFGRYLTLDSLGIQNPTGGRGMLIINNRGGAANRITVRNCVFQNIKSDTYNHETGGLVVRTDGDEPAWFEDLLIENNTFLNVSRSGIFVTGIWADRPVPGWGKNQYISDDEGWYPHRRVTVRGNYMDHIGGDGIVVIGTVDCLMEHNRLFHAQCEDHAGNFCAGIWPMNCNHVVVQYNEVGYTHLGKGGDGEGFDIDSNCKDVLFQYNYSHHNDGGFLLICCCQFNEGIVVRYNVSVNDTCQRGRATFTISGPNSGAQIYHNTIYLGEGSSYDFKLVEAADYQNCGGSTDFTFYNNLFVVAKDRVVSGYFDKQTGFVFDNNVYSGMEPFSHSNITTSRSQCVTPTFVLAEQTGYGRETARAYTPVRSEWMSKAIPAEDERDFFGNPVKDMTFYGAICPQDITG